MLQVVVSPSMAITNTNTDAISSFLVLSILWVLDVSCLVFSCQSFYCDSMLFSGAWYSDRVSKLLYVICTVARWCLMALVLLMVAELNSGLLCIWWQFCCQGWESRGCREIRPRSWTLNLPLIVSRLLVQNQFTRSLLSRFLERVPDQAQFPYRAVFWLDVRHPPPP